MLSLDRVLLKFLSKDEDTRLLCAGHLQLIASKIIIFIRKIYLKKTHVALEITRNKSKTLLLGIILKKFLSAVTVKVTAHLTRLHSGLPS